MAQSGDASSSQSQQATENGTALRPVARSDSGPVAKSPEEPAPVSQVVAPGRLGTTVASLGSPAEPGLWLKTPLVSSQQAGKISYNGKTIAVTLIPIDGPDTAGSRLSLQAFQALGAALTDLVELSVSV